MAGPRRLESLAGRVLEAGAGDVPQASCAVALSGGADSAICAWVAGQVGVPVRGVFVNHSLPGSSFMAAAADRVAASLDIPLKPLDVVVPEGSSPEAQLRRARYDALLKDLARDEWLLTGHTADDQAETVMLNLIRGAGLRGLTGIPRRRGSIVRPLLGVWRSETRELATLLGIPWQEDPANLDERTPRNALRLSVLPGLEQAFNPAFRKALVRVATQAAAAEELIEAQADFVAVEKTGDEVRLAAPAMASVPDVVAAAAARRALRLWKGGYPGTEADARALIATSADGRTRGLTGNVQARREGPWTVLGARDATVPAPSDWDLRGEARFGTWLIEAWVEESPPSVYPLSRWIAVFDAEQVEAKGQVRGVNEDDRIAMREGSKDVMQALAEAGVPARKRSSRPVVTAGGDVLWVPGVRAAQSGWVSRHTRRYLWLRARQEGG